MKNNEPDFPVKTSAPVVSWGSRDGWLSTWIPVADQLPASGERVLVWVRDQGLETAIYWPRFGFTAPHVTHWMPLPKAPPAREMSDA